MELEWEKVKHLWNATRLMSKVNGDEANNLRIHYIDRCRALGNRVDLPKQRFGPSVMCSHCGSLWVSMEHKIRIVRGRKPSKSILKLIRSSERSNRQLSKYHVTLINKCIKNQTNKMFIKCSVCSMNTIIPFNKPKREKVAKPDAVKPSLLVSSRKKKKKRTKDRTAGLNIPVNDVSGSKASTSVQVTIANTTTPKSKIKTVATTPSLKKSKKKDSNILKSTTKRNLTSSTKSSLHRFLKDLCQ